MAKPRNRKWRLILRTCYQKPDLRRLHVEGEGYCVHQLPDRRLRWHVRPKHGRAVPVETVTDQEGEVERHVSSKRVLSRIHLRGRDQVLTELFIASGDCFCLDQRGYDQIEL